jgi:hypothetical protein
MLRYYRGGHRRRHIGDFVSWPPVAHLFSRRYGHAIKHGDAIDMGCKLRVVKTIPALVFAPAMDDRFFAACAFHF